jgi:hypothetical protein
MKSMIFKLLAVACTTAILVACGGGGGGSTTGANNGATPAPDAPKVFTPWASPAMFVPEGQASISVALTCNDYNDTPQTTVPVNSATLQITSAGDLVFSAAVGTASVVELVNIKYSEATYQYIDSAVGGNNLGAAYVELQKDNAQIYAGWNASGGPSYFEARPNNLVNAYFCSLTAGYGAFSLQRPLSEERLAATMLTGVNQISKDNLNGEDTRFGQLTNGLVYWDNHVFDASAGSTAQDAIRYFSLNLSTGEMTGAASTTVPQTSPTNLRLLLPTTTTTFGFFSEEISEGEKGFEFQVTPNSGARISIDFKVFGNVLSPDDGIYNGL